MEESVWAVCDADHKLLEVFQTKKLALDSIKYSFHALFKVKLIEVSYYEFQISAVKADHSRLLVTFYVNHMTITSGVIHL